MFSGRNPTHFGRDSIAVFAADMLSTQQHKQVKPGFSYTPFFHLFRFSICWKWDGRNGSQSGLLHIIGYSVPSYSQNLTASSGSPLYHTLSGLFSLAHFYDRCSFTSKTRGKGTSKCSKIKHIVFQPRWAFLRDRWCQFDVFILCVHWVSWGLHVYQITALLFPAFRLIYREWFGVIRSVRPFIIVKLIRLVVKFKLPKNRIEQLLK